MFQPSLSFLSQSIPEAMKTLGSFRSIDHLPEPLMHGVVDMIEALMNCFPAAAEIYYPLHDAPENGADFNHAEEALRFLTPAFEAATYPLRTEHGTLSADTPLAVAQSPHQAMMLLEESYRDVNANHVEDEWEVLYDMTERLLEGHPSLKTSIDRGYDNGEPGFDYFAEAYRGIKAANRASQPRLALAA